MTTEAFGLLDGKVTAGVTVLRDPQTGRTYDVVDVLSGRMPMPEHAYFRHSTAGQCALYGRPAKDRARRPRRAEAPR